MEKDVLQLTSKINTSIELPSEVNKVLEVDDVSYFATQLELKSEINEQLPVRSALTLEYRSE